MKIHQAALRFMPFSMLCYTSRKSFSWKCFGNWKLEDIISSWENRVINTSTRKLTFWLYIILLLTVHHCQGKIFLFSGKQIMSSSSSSSPQELQHIKNLWYTKARCHLNSSCILTYLFFIVALWSSYYYCLHLTEAEIETQWGWKFVQGHSAK